MSLSEAARQYVQNRIAADFHSKRLASLEGLRLAHLSAQEETLFGAFLEGLGACRAWSADSENRPQRGQFLPASQAHSPAMGQEAGEKWTAAADLQPATSKSDRLLAIHICAQAYGGRKSTTEGIDLEFSRDGTRYIVSIKSGPNWGNSSQIAKMVQNFDRARRIAGPREHVMAVNGCCYGADAHPAKTGNYLKLCGQDFWHLISGEPLLYRQIIEPLGHEARQRNDEFEQAFARLHTRFTADFTQAFCRPDASIDWDKIVALNSSAKTLWQP
ncbi:PmeII family type II restriction endonuclease [Ramlibacter sp. H39-3-26]|uniref:PmeII family type II restriction endonuclease n=1 Tax=Curvibacter soli TaxID=3031331 RepID=UPI0023D98EBE|nr:PmeII family type II restriction endonuclease [Ramlibacter sp. H39-3-26]MDF1486094.1 PmeII family type II restriction endonuclease [Ramlibacter sp. H39-3-26]